MRIITLIFVIFFARCAHLEITDNVANLENSIKDIGSEIEDKIEDLGEKMKDIAEKVIPSCFFGVKSVSMDLFTRDIPDGKVIAANESYDIDPTKPVIFLVHGFISSANTTNSYKLASELVKRDYTVFSLDWSQGACTDGLPVIKLTGYPSAVENTREIGHFMSSYVMSLIDKHDVPLENIMFIGHSLGAHVCGFAAKRIQEAGYGTIPRLLAADPAAPLFANNKCENRLCTTDAKRLIVFHTSALGIQTTVGHVDLYMNKGITQPGCNINIVCSHSRAVEYLADVLEDNCGFPGVSISTMDLILGRTPAYPNASTTDCIVVNSKIYENDNIKDGKYYVFVKSESPYCTEESFSCQQ